MRVNFQWSFTMWADLYILVELSQVPFTFGTFLSGTLMVFCLLVCLFFPNSIWCSLLSSCMDPSLNFPWGLFQGPCCLYALWLTTSHAHTSASHHHHHYHMTSAESPVPFPLSLYGSKPSKAILVPVGITCSWLSFPAPRVVPSPFFSIPSCFLSNHWAIFSLPTPVLA